MKQILILFAPGAGASSSSPWMKKWQKRLDTLGDTVPFDYPYMRAKRRAPDKLPVLIDAHRQALAGARVGRPGPVVLMGKSMGSRIGCHVSLVEKDVRALVCFGYPLQAAGKTGSVRDEVLLALEVPILFVAGTRDPLCPLDLLASVRPRMKARSDLFVVEGGNHSLEISASVRKATKKTQEDVDGEIFTAVTRFLEEAVSLR
jgi:predicted alpha/beta-hydrolase family hydrolase